jgi:hypothetical protein
MCTNGTDAGAGGAGGGVVAAALVALAVQGGTLGAVLVAAAIQGNPKQHLDDCHASRVVGLGR